MNRAAWCLLWIALIAMQPKTALAQSAPSCSYQPDGSILCTTGGGGGAGDEGGQGTNGGGNTCTPGDHLSYLVHEYNAGAGTCRASPVWIDNCTGQILETAGDTVQDLPCEIPAATPPEHPCTSFAVAAGGISCTNADWDVTARVAFPEILLDVRPYPASLVRWPTTVRNGGMPESSGSGGVNHVPLGGGSSAHPQVGDWQNLRLVLTLRPAGPMFVTLPWIGDLMLSPGASRTFQWELPSHPVVGATTTAGNVSGLDELPVDIPLFSGHGRAPYKLFWELRYREYQAVQGCLPGPNSNGRYNCGAGTGHRGITGYEWRNHSDGGEIPPSAVSGLPAARMADINNDGIPDAYWNSNLTLRRMDDAGSVSDTRYQRSWNWGGMIYWAVREGQGQIGWPGR